MIIPTGYAQVNLFWTGNGYLRGAQTVIGVENSTGKTAAEIATLVGNNWVLSMLENLSSSIALEKVRAKLGPNSTGAEAEVVFGDVGGLAQQPLPPNVTGLITKRTVLGGRKARGKIFHPGFCETQTDGAGKFTPTALTDIQADLDELLGNLDGTDLPMVLLHSDATTPYVVTDLELQQLMATQRRRIRKVGGRRTP